MTAGGYASPPRHGHGGDGAATGSKCLAQLDVDAGGCRGADMPAPQAEDSWSHSLEAPASCPPPLHSSFQGTGGHPSNMHLWTQVL